MRTCARAPRAAPHGRKATVVDVDDSSSSSEEESHINVDGPARSSSGKASSIKLVQDDDFEVDESNDGSRTVGVDGNN